MLLTNPFTKQVVNANPEGCNQYKKCAVRSLEDSYSAIGQSAGIPVEYVSDEHPELGGAMGITIPGKKVLVSRGVTEREVAAHEVGHSVTDPFGIRQSDPDENIRREAMAWKWALKNRGKLGLSKRKILRAVRSHARAVDTSPRQLLYDKPLPDLGVSWGYDESLEDYRNRVEQARLDRKTKMGW